MAALLYLFFNNPPNKKKKSPYIKNGWLYYFRTHPLLLSLSLSFSLSPSARPLPPQKRTHCYKEQKKKKGCVTACKLHCYLFVSFLSLTPHLPSSLFPLSLALSFSIPLTLPSPSSPDQSRIRQTCLVSLSLARSHATTLAFCIADPDTNLSNMATLYSPEPPPLCFKKKKRNYFGAAAVGLGTRLYIYVCVCERVRVYECWGGIEREREWVREGGWENLPQPCPDLHQIVLLKKLTTCGGDGNRSGYAKPRFHL